MPRLRRIPFTLCSAVSLLLALFAAAGWAVETSGFDRGVGVRLWQWDRVRVELGAGRSSFAVGYIKSIHDGRTSHADWERMRRTGGSYAYPHAHGFVFFRGESVVRGAALAPDGVTIVNGIKRFDWRMMIGVPTPLAFAAFAIMPGIWGARAVQARREAARRGFSIVNGGTGGVRSSDAGA